MGLNNALNFGLQGLAMDAFTTPLGTGPGLMMGVAAGLFSPDGQDMNQAYDGSRFARYPMHQSGFPMLEGLFGNTQGGPRDPAPVSQQKEWSGGAKALAMGAMALMGAANGGGPFSMPLFGWATGLTPYNSGGAIPQMWSSGAMGNWGAWAGVLT